MEGKERKNFDKERFGLSRLKGEKGRKCIEEDVEGNSEQRTYPSTQKNNPIGKRGKGGNNSFLCKSTDFNLGIQKKGSWY